MPIVVETDPYLVLLFGSHAHFMSTIVSAHSFLLDKEQTRLSIFWQP